MNSNLKKIDLEQTILHTIDNGFINSDSKSNISMYDAISINERSLIIWNIILENSDTLDTECLLITKRFYSFISNITPSHHTLYLSCLDLLNDYLEACLNNNQCTSV